MELDISSDNEERFLRKEVSPVGSSAHRMLEVEQMNESLLKEIQQVVRSAPPQLRRPPVH